MGITQGVNEQLPVDEGEASAIEDVAVTNEVSLGSIGLEFVDIPEGASEPTDDNNGSSPAKATEALGRVARLHQTHDNSPPTQLISDVTQAIDSVLADAKSGTISTGVLANIVFNGQRVPRREFRAFVAAANRDPRLEYVGDGIYKVINRQEEHMFVPEENTLETIIDRTIEVLSRGTRADFNAQQALSVVRSLGIMLSSAKIDKFYAMLIGDSRIGVRESGTFIIKRLQDEYDQTGGIVAPFDPDSDPREFRNEDGRPLSAKQIDLAMRAITYGPEVRMARDRAMRTIKPKRRGHQPSDNNNKKSVKGKAHGRKVSLDDLIEAMNTDPSD